MNAAEGVTSDGDTHDLCRVVQALTEVRSGQKRSHWIGFIYPQHDGLGVGVVCGITSLSPEKNRAFADVDKRRSGIRKRH